jgi:hypothetical protein
MVTNTAPANGREVRAANGERFKSGQIEENTVTDGVFTPVFEVQADRTTVYMVGFGFDSRQRGRVGWADLDLQNGGGSPVDGSLRWEVYRDSSKEDLVAKSGTFRTEDLRSAVGADRTEKDVMPQEAPAAPQDGYLVLAIDPDSGSSGNTLNQANSATDLGIPFARIQ